MSIGPSFDTSALRIRLKAAEDKVNAFEYGEKYVRMQEQFKAVFRMQNAKIRRLEEELGRAHAQTVSVRKIWSEIFLKLFSAPVLHADFTFGRMNGSQTAVMICAAGDTILYQGRPKKGDEGVEGSPLEFYDGILVSDHEAALIKHGSKNQELWRT